MTGAWCATIFGRTRHVCCSSNNSAPMRKQENEQTVSVNEHAHPASLSDRNPQVLARSCLRHLRAYRLSIRDMSVVVDRRRAETELVASGPPPQTPSPRDRDVDDCASQALSYASSFHLTCQPLGPSPPRNCTDAVSPAESAGSSSSATSSSASDSSSSSPSRTTCYQLSSSSSSSPCALSAASSSTPSYVTGTSFQLWQSIVTRSQVLFYFYINHLLLSRLDCFPC